MVKYLSFIAFLQLFGAVFTCRDGRNQVTLPQITDVRWLHSHEEDHDSVRVYRPQGYDFPASRGRTGFELKQHGEALYGEIAPTDGIVWNRASWQMQGDDQLRIETSPEKGVRKASFRMRILEAEEDKLTVVFWEDT